jgi:GT2 family glycosyltransferase
MPRIAAMLATAQGGWLLRGNVIFGFVTRPAPSDLPPITLRSAGKPVVSIRPIGPSPLARACGVREPHTGFTIDLGICGLAGAPPGRRIEIEVGWRQLRMLGRAGALDRSVDYYVDDRAAGEIRGWAWSPAGPERPLLIEACLDGTVYAQVTAGRYALNLLEAGKGDGATAFTVAAPLVTGPDQWLGLRVAGRARPFWITAARGGPSPRLAKLEIARSLGGLSGRLELARQPIPGAQLWIRLGNGIHLATTDAEGWFSVSGQNRVGDGPAADEPPGYRIAWNGHELAQGGLADRRTKPPTPRRNGGGSTPRPEEDAPAASLHAELTRELTLEVTLEDAPAGAAPPACDVIIDGEAIATLRLAAEADSAGGQRHRATLRLAHAWADGRAHRVEIKALGTGGERLGAVLESVVLGRPLRPLAVTAHWRKGNSIVGRITFAGPPPAGDFEVALMRREREIARGRAEAVEERIGTASVGSPALSFKLTGLGKVSASGVLTFRIEGPGGATSWPAPLPTAVDRALAIERPWQLVASGDCFVMPIDAVSPAGQACAISLLAHAAAGAARERAITLAIWPGQASAVAALIARSPVAALAAAARRRLVIRELVAPPVPVQSHAPFDSYVMLDLWLRASRFRRIFAGLRGGALAPLIDAKRQGLAYAGTRLIVLLDSATLAPDAVEAALPDSEQSLLLDALERHVMAGADIVIAPNRALPAMLAASGTRGRRRIAVRPFELAAGTLEPSSHAPITEHAAPPGLLVVTVGTGGHNVVSMLEAALILAGDRGSAGGLGTVLVGHVGEAADIHSPLVEALKRRYQAVEAIDFDTEALRAHLERGRRPAGALVTDTAVGTVWEAMIRAAGVPMLVLATGPAGYLAHSPSEIAGLLAKCLEGGGAEWSSPARPAAAAAPAAVGAPFRQQAIGRRPEQATSAVTGERAAGAARPPLVSVCVTHFNRPAYLWQALRAIDAGTYPSIEIVVVDDGSSLPGIEAELARVAAWLDQRGGRLLRQSNRYLGAARNAAWQASRGSLVAFVDDDNLACPDMIERFVEVWGRTGADALTCQLFTFEGNAPIDPARSRPPTLSVPPGPDLVLGAVINCFGDANMMVERRVLEQTGGFTEIYGRGHEDWELLTRLALEGYRIERIMQPLFWYRISGDSMLRAARSTSGDLARNLYAYAAAGRPDLYRLALLANGRVPRPLG